MKCRARIYRNLFVRRSGYKVNKSRNVLRALSWKERTAGHRETPGPKYTHFHTNKKPHISLTVYVRVCVLCVCVCISRDTHAHLSNHESEPEIKFS